MIEYIDKLSRYLPLECDYEENDYKENEEYWEYVQYLRDTCSENIDNHKYQFALLAFHMMFMSFVYKQFLCLKKHDYLKVKRFCDKNQRLNEVYKTFDMSELPEKQSIDFTMNALGFHTNRRGDVQSFVDTRDKCAHASGFIQYDENKVETHFSEVLDYVKQIFDKTKDNVRKVFILGVHDYWNSGSYDSYLSVEQATKIIKQLGLSAAEIIYILETDKDEMIGEHIELTYQLSYLILMMVLKEYLIDSLELIPEDINEDLESNQLLEFIKNLDNNEYKQIQIELEDELAAINEFYEFDKYEEIVEGINKIHNKAV